MAPTGVELVDHGAFLDGDVDTGPSSASVRIPVGSDVTVSGSTLVGGEAVHMEGGTASLARLHVRSANSGIFVGAGQARITDSLIDVEPQEPPKDIYGIRVFKADVEADGVTVIGAPGTESVGVIAFNPGAHLALRDSVLAAPRQSIYWLTGPSAAATIDVAYSDLDPDLTHDPPSGPASVNLGAGDLNVLPGFLSATDFHLAAGSPLIDAGDPAAVGGLDLDKAPRIIGGRRDMGAYEFQPSLVPAPPPAPGDGGAPPAPPGPAAASGAGAGGGAAVRRPAAKRPPCAGLRAARRTACLAARRHRLAVARCTRLKGSRRSACLAALRRREALARCAKLKGSRRAACVARARGQHVRGAR